MQTYFITEGKYFPGNTNRPGMEEVSFLEIAQDLAYHLKQQNFFSEENPDAGDLLILVHYGVTDYEANYMEYLNVDSMDDFGFGSIENDDPLLERSVTEEFQAQVYDMQSIHAGSMEEVARRAKLLGMDELLSPTTNDQRINELWAMLEEERYFIVLQAFDLPAFREGEKKLLWSTHYSMHAGAKRFDQAIAELNVVASNYFGKNMKGLNMRRATDKGDVKVGDVEVIEGGTN